MNKPHKYCEVIKAWADGGEIQFSPPNLDEWTDFPRDSNKQTPNFHIEFKWRIKPITLRYQVALMHEKKPIDNYYVDIVTKQETNDNCILTEKSPDFVKWLTNWVEVEV